MPVDATMTGFHARNPVFSFRVRRSSTPLRCLQRIALISMTTLVWMNAMAAEQTPGEGGPPMNYRLDEVSVELTRQPGRGPFHVRRLTLSGAGGATLQSDGKTYSFSYPGGDLLTLLNDLYGIRFFSLPANLTARYSVFLKADGTVSTSKLQLADAPGTSVCVTLSAYRKCVTYGSDGPADIERIVRRAFSEADGLVGRK